MDKCRLCLSENDNLTNVSEEREGLPLSVIAMIICPIKIEKSDNLPKQICGDCVEILLTAYNLRDTSNQNDRFLRGYNDSEPFVKLEQIAEETSIFFEPSIYADDNTRSDSDEENESDGMSEPTQTGAYTVDCFRADNKSFVWKFFGALCDDKGNVIDKEFYYCKFCVKKGELIKYSKQNATTCYSRHLRRLHNIGDDSKISDSLPKEPDIFTCDLCALELNSKTAIRIHMQQKHSDLSTLSKGDYIVDCHKQGVSPSLVWSYFGRLLELDGTEVESADGYNFCRICVEEKNILTKFSVTNATSALMHHISSKHNVKLDKQPEKPVQQEHFNLSPLSRGDTYIIDCYKLGLPSTTSIVWSYFGKLLELDGTEVEAASGYHFCRICLEERNILTKFSASNATSALMHHISSKHNVKYHLKPDKQPEKKPEKQSEKPKVEIKEELVESFNGYSVHCHKASINKSFAWNYIGMLIGPNKEPIESEVDFVFCKLCVSKGKLKKKFKKTCATTNLLKHLKIAHGVVNNRTEADETLIVKKAERREEPQEKTCSLCNESFETRKAYFNHVRSVHKTIESLDFVCHVCSKSFTKSYILAKHMRLHSGIDYSCSVCPATFNYPEGLKRHEKIHDPAHLSKYQCDQCSNSYAEKKSLKTHILIVHLNKAKPRNYRCEFCEMAFATTGNLKRHVMKHTGEKPHECQYCDVAYTQKGDLIKHLQKAHNTMYKCAHTNCSASFRLQVELREHYRVHFVKPIEEVEEDSIEDP